MYRCDKCGMCCMQVGTSSFYAFLDRGDGTCRHFDDTTHLCKIYDHRPVICNIDAMYSRCYQSKMSREMYDQLNYAACAMLKKRYAMNCGERKE